jgi:Mg2+ and Co2+ transporter CorA
MASENGNGATRQSLHTGIQVGTVVAGISIVAYLMQPINVELGRLSSQITDHMAQAGHAEVLAQIAALRTEITSIRTEIAGQDRLNATLHDGQASRLDRVQGAEAQHTLALAELQSMVSRLEALVGTLIPLSAHSLTSQAPLRSNSNNCFTGCHPA